MKPINQGQILLPIARASIATAFGQKYEAPEDATWLLQPEACFVTLTKLDQLRGCVGSVEACRSLLDDVKHNAKAAAFKDTRFSPLTAEELGDIEIEISLLSPLSALKFSDEQEALAQLQPGIDGVVFECGDYRSTFLPQVWERLPVIGNFMANLKQKAGLKANFWADEVKLYHYTVSKWKERDFREQTR